MKIAVLLSTYNGVRYMTEEIDSILAQKLDDGDELVLYIRDDGSSDATREIIEQYESENDNVRFVNRENPCNVGVRRSFLDLMEYAYQDSDSDFFAFADQDDVWLDDKLRAGMRMIKDAPVSENGALYYSNKTFVDEKLELIKEENIQYYGDIVEALWTSLAFGCTMVFDRRLAGLCLRKKPTTTIYHDSWVYHTAKFTGSTVVFDPKSHILYRQHGDNNVGIEGAKLYHENVFYLLKRAIPVIFKKHPHSKQKYIEEVYKTFQDCIPAENARYAKDIIRYRFNPIAKLRLVHNRYMRRRRFKTRVIWAYMVWFNRI